MKVWREDEEGSRNEGGRRNCAQVFSTIENMSLLLLLTQWVDSRWMQVEKNTNSKKELVLL